MLTKKDLKRLNGFKHDSKRDTLSASDFENAFHASSKEKKKPFASKAYTKSY